MLTLKETTSGQRLLIFLGTINIGISVTNAACITGSYNCLIGAVGELKHLLPQPIIMLPLRESLSHIETPYVLMV